MKYIQYGEQLGIGASCHFLNLGGKNIIIDSGIGFARENGKENNNNFAPAGNYFADKKIDLILVTHHHVDHVGSLPRLASTHPNTLIVMSETAFAGAEIMLRDGLKINERRYFSAQRNGEFAEIIYDREDLEEFLNGEQTELIEGACWFEPWSGWKIGIHPSGHNPGARMYFIFPPNDRPVIITGDISRHDQEIVKGTLLPNKKFLGNFLEQKGIVLITEGTNGTRGQIKSREEIKKNFIKTVKEVRDQGGQVFCPAFSSNRTANIAAMFIEAGIVPHIDGLAKKMLAVELSNFQQLVEEGKIILFENGTNPKKRKATDRHKEMVACGQDPCGHEFSPVISPQATLDFGFAVEHATRYLPKKKNAVIFTGHIFEFSKAEKLMNIKRGRTIKLPGFNGKKTTVNVRCDVHHFDFTGHDYREGLLDRIKAVNPMDTIIHHCTKESFYGLARGIREIKTPTKVHWGKHMRKIRL